MLLQCLLSLARVFLADGPWPVLESISLPLLEEAAGSVYVRPNEGTTPLVLDLGSYDGGNICVRSTNIALGSNQNCNFPLAEEAKKTEV